VLVAISLFSCAIKKRAYRPGYYISWHRNSNAYETRRNKDLAGSNSSEKRKSTATEYTFSEPLPTAAAGGTLSERSLIKEKLTVLQSKDECGDLISFRKGNEIKAKVIEINETQIKYKRCDNSDGPLIIANKNEVRSIKFVNGLVEYFEVNTSERKKETFNNIEPQKHPLVNPTILFTVGMILIPGFFIGGLILGTRAKKEILSEPARYTGLRTIKICLVICWVVACLAALFVLFGIYFFILLFTM
jgi:hypothetical protein